MCARYQDRSTLRSVKRIDVKSAAPSTSRVATFVCGITPKIAVKRPVSSASDTTTSTSCQLAVAASLPAVTMATARSAVLAPIDASNAAAAAATITNERALDLTVSTMNDQTPTMG